MHTDKYPPSALSARGQRTISVNTARAGSVDPFSETPVIMAALSDPSPASSSVLPLRLGARWLLMWLWPLPLCMDG